MSQNRIVAWTTSSFQYRVGVKESVIFHRHPDGTWTIARLINDQNS